MKNPNYTETLWKMKYHVERKRSLENQGTRYVKEDAILELDPNHPTNPSHLICVRAEPLWKAHLKK